MYRIAARWNRSNSEIPKLPNQELWQTLSTWIKLGCISFGGTTAHLALLREELVERRRWISPEAFLDALGFCTLLPGPEATQLAIYIGYLRDGKRGGVLAGVCFIAPSLLLLWALSLLYVRFGQLPAIATVLTGLRPAILAMIAASLYKLARHSLDRIVEWGVAILATVCLLPLHVPAPYVVAGVLFAYAAFQTFRRWRIPSESQSQHRRFDTALLKLLQTVRTALIFFFIACAPLLVFQTASHEPRFWRELALFFTKTAFVTVGGSYTVLPYVATRAVHELHWLTRLQMADGMTLAETTPGPLIIVVVFVGFMAGFQHFHSLTGATGALAVSGFYTFLPCFLFVFVGAPFADLLKTPRIRGGLRLVTAVVLAAMFQLLVFLTESTLLRQNASILMRWSDGVFAVALTIALIRLRLSTLLVVLLGVVYGFAVRLSLHG